MPRLFVVAAVLASLSLPLGAAEQAGTARLIFVAGPKDHGGAGAHEHSKDLNGLKACLANSNVKNLAVEVYDGKVPDVKVLAGAKVLVMESSGDRYEQEAHALFPFDGTTDHQSYAPEMMTRLKQINDLARAGMGVVVLHYATYVNNATARKYFTDWVGGFYESGYSRTSVTEWNVAPTEATHPILRGVTPFTVREEFYIRNRMPETDPRRTSLLIATPTRETRLPALTAPMVPGGPPSPLTGPNIEPSLVSWAVQREGGGRGFVMTGVHSHQLLVNVESYRREVLNGIVWAAGLDVPAGGVACSMPAE
jgi:type 1 glutamine amidotransferase